MKCEKIRDNFGRNFHKKSPTDKAIRKLLTKFQRTGSVHDDSNKWTPKEIWGKNGIGRRIGDLAELRNRIIDAVQDITPQMLGSVFRETIYRFELCRENGRHVETNK
jgi:hypothetical protein